MVPVFLQLGHLLLEEAVTPLAALVFGRELTLLGDCLGYFGMEILHDHLERISHHKHNLVAFEILVQEVSHRVGRVNEPH